MKPRILKLLTSDGRCGKRVARSGGCAFDRRASQAGRRGFTIIELLTVITIIGIILSLVLVAGMEAANRAKERATQTLIIKLEAGLNDRLEAVLQTRPDYTIGHLALANVYYSSTDTIPAITRAQVIAWYDYIKAEMPDVFFVQNAAPGNNDYPLNFAGNPIPGVTGIPSVILPIFTQPPAGTTFAPGTGIYGASYTAAAGIYKNLGYLPAGYDGVDNDTDGLVDEYSEGIGTDPQVQDPTDPSRLVNTSSLIATRLAAHTHTTARSEMLYALLVEGRGAFGSVFTRDDFTASEVQDTDNDGLPEFVDAWGQPLQFFRWPLLYHSDIQRGQVLTATSPSSWTFSPPYLSVFETREQDPLDPNQQLLAPSWWFKNFNGPGSINATYSGTAGSLGASNGVMAFEWFFHRLTEPDPYSSTNYSFYWDRSNANGYGTRRAFYSKFLVVSGGPDQTVGIFRYPDSGPPSANPNYLIANENNALGWNPTEMGDFTSSAVYTTTTIDATTPFSQAIQQAAQDDISNQNLPNTGGIGGSG